MAAPTPLQSLLGGLSIPIPVHALMLLNGSVFGISGYVHRAAQGSLQALMAVAGLVLGGMAVGKLEAAGPTSSNMPLSHIILSGLLVGLGSKLANGCTSGHMICGISRFSVRSIAATATFFTTGAITAHFMHSDLPPITAAADWSLGPHGAKLLALQALPLAIAVGLYNFAPDLNKETISTKSNGKAKASPSPSPLPESPSAQLTSREINVTDLTPQNAPHSLLRGLTYLVTSFQFALSLRLSNLTEAKRVMSFLLLPIHKAFDPSLFFLAIGALPLAALLYRYARGDEKPRLGGMWAIPKPGELDTKLLAGAAIFGIGWGLGGACPGPGLVNFGRALASGSDLTQVGAWLGGVVLGGLMV